MKNIVSVFESTYKQILAEIRKSGIYAFEEASVDPYSVQWDIIDNYRCIVINPNADVNERLLMLTIAFFSLKANLTGADKLPDEVSRKARDYLVERIGARNYAKIIIKELRKLPIEKLEEMSI